MVSMNIQDKENSTCVLSISVWDAIDLEIERAERVHEVDYFANIYVQLRCLNEVEISLQENNLVNKSRTHRSLHWNLIIDNCKITWSNILGLTESIKHVYLDQLSLRNTQIVEHEYSASVAADNSQHMLSMRKLEILYNKKCSWYNDRGGNIAFTVSQGTSPNNCPLSGVEYIEPYVSVFRNVKNYSFMQGNFMHYRTKYIKIF